MNASQAAIPGHSAATPLVTELTVVPVAGHDTMLMNLSGAHGPYFTRNIVILRDSAGNTGVGEVPGGEASARRSKTRGRWSWDSPSASTRPCSIARAPRLPAATPAAAACRPSTCASPSTP